METYWEAREINLGNHKQATVVKGHFKAKENIPKIKEVIAGCSCSVAGYDEAKKQIDFAFRERIPEHIKTETHPVSRHLTVLYESGAQEVLIFNAVLLR